MKKQITINNEIFCYQLRSSKKARRVRLAVCTNGEVVLTKPFFVPLLFAERFLIKKIDWIKKALAKKNASEVRIPRRHRQAYLKYKENTRRFVHQALEKYNQVYNYNYKSIRIKNQKTRWGSCSQGGNLNFSYRLIHMPERMAEYIVVHELCHLQELNHSKKFWQLVAITFPDYKKIEKQLRLL